MRRILTGNIDGKPAIILDGEPANAHDYKGWPGHSTSVVWATAASPAVPMDAGDEPGPGFQVLPQPGETRLLIVRFPPDSIFADPRFDGPGYGQEAAQYLTGLIDSFEPDGSGFHRTSSVDYDIVIEGEITLDLGDGTLAHLKAGDVVVQNGTRHAWRNQGDRDAVMAFVLIGALDAR